MWRKLLLELTEVPWPEIARLVVTLLCCWLTWALSKHWYAKQWTRFAPDKAKDELLAARRDLEAARRVIRGMQTDNVEMRGRIAAAAHRLEKPHQLELIERAAGR